MRKRAFIPVAIVLLSLAFAGASPAQTQYDEIIHGTWQWSYTDNNGEIDNPGTLGYEIAVEFNEDFTYREYHNDILVIDSTYSTFLVEDNGAWLYVDRPEPRFTANAFRPAPDELALRDDHANPTITEIWLERGPVATEGRTWSAVKALYER